MVEVSWLLFLAASLVVILTPGQDMILVMSRSIGQGPRAGIVTAAGVSVGLVGHTFFAALTFVVKGPIGYGAGALSGWLRSHAAVLAWLNRTSGAVLIGLGVRLAFQEPR
jgi:threonine/homoserine/homoserine lactone efflux protein